MEKINSISKSDIMLRYSDRNIAHFVMINISYRYTILHDHKTYLAYDNYTIIEGRRIYRSIRRIINPSNGFMIFLLTN